MPRPLPDNPTEVLTQAMDIITSLNARVEMLEDQIREYRSNQSNNRNEVADAVASIRKHVDDELRRKLDNPNILTKSLILRYMQDHNMLSE